MTFTFPNFVQHISRYIIYKFLRVKIWNLLYKHIFRNIKRFHVWNSTDKFCKSAKCFIITYFMYVNLVRWVVKWQWYVRLITNSCSLSELATFCGSEFRLYEDAYTKAIKPETIIRESDLTLKNIKYISIDLKVVFRLKNLKI